MAVPNGIDYLWLAIFTYGMFWIITVVISALSGLISSIIIKQGLSENNWRDLLYQRRVGDWTPPLVTCNQSQSPKRSLTTLFLPDSPSLSQPPACWTSISTAARESSRYLIPSCCLIFADTHLASVTWQTVAMPFPYKRYWAIHLSRWPASMWTLLPVM